MWVLECNKATSLVHSALEADDCSGNLTDIHGTGRFHNNCHDWHRIHSHIFHSRYNLSCSDKKTKQTNQNAFKKQLTIINTYLHLSTTMHSLWHFSLPLHSLWHVRHRSVLHGFSTYSGFGRHLSDLHGGGGGGSWTTTNCSFTTYSGSGRTIGTGAFLRRKIPKWQMCER